MKKDEPQGHKKDGPQDHAVLEKNGTTELTELKLDDVVKTSIYCVVALFPALDIPYVCLRT
jgi:hypothetical protein